MSWLENIRKKTYHEKMRIIWTVIVITVILLIVVWIVTARVQKSLPKDTTFFQTIVRGFHDVGQQYKDNGK